MIALLAVLLTLGAPPVRYGGELEVHVFGSLDLEAPRTQAELFLLGLVGEPLVEPGVTPVCAAACTLTVPFPERAGHEGRISAAEVARSLGESLSAPSDDPFREALAASLAGDPKTAIRADGEHLIFNLRGPDVAIWSDPRTAPAVNGGSGPFQRRDDEWLEAFVGHRAGRPRLDRIHLVGVGTARAAEQALRTEGADLVLGVPSPPEAAELHGQPLGEETIWVQLSGPERGERTQIEKALDRTRLAHLLRARPLPGPETPLAPAAPGPSGPSTLCASDQRIARRFVDRLQLDLLRAGKRLAIAAEPPCALEVRVGAGAVPPSATRIPLATWTAYAWFRRTPAGVAWLDLPNLEAPR